jgi:hypothetical protein
MEKKTELSVITKSKELCNYILTVTEKSPKRFRFTLTGKIQNYALNVIEMLIKANEIYVYETNRTLNMQLVQERVHMQREAMTNLKLLSYMAQVAMEQQCILPKQYEQITRKIYDCQNLLGAWMKSDAKRFQKRS